MDEIEKLKKELQDLVEIAKLNEEQISKLEKEKTTN